MKQKITLGRTKDNKKKKKNINNYNSNNINRNNSIQHKQQHNTRQK